MNKSRLSNIPKLYEESRIQMHTYSLGHLQFNMVVNTHNEFPYSVYHLVEGGEKVFIGDYRRLESAKIGMKSYYIKHGKDLDEQFNATEAGRIPNYVGTGREPGGDIRRETCILAESD